MPEPSRPPIIDVCFPERRFGGFSRIDGTIAFYVRVRALLSADHHALDIGCGRGRWIDDPSQFRRELQTMKGHCAHVLGIDVDPGAAVNPFVDEFRLITDFERWPVEDESIDLAVCDYVLEHVQQPEKFFEELRRVLKPGGYICMRVPNAWSYVALATRLIPNSLHARVLKVAQPARKERDVFPTYFRCNTKRALQRMLRTYGFDAAIYRNEAEPGYLGFSRIAYRIGVVAHRFLPPIFKSTLLAFGRRVS